MKLTIQRDVLITGLSRVIDSAQTKVTMPILCSVLLEAGTALTIIATNLDVLAKTSVPAAVKEPGQIAINAKRLLEIARSAPADDISISADSKLRVSIKSGSASFSFIGMDSNEFPAIPEHKEVGMVECAGSALANMLGSVAFCQSTDASRYILMGVHVELKDSQLVIEATNGARLARNVKTVDSKSAFSLIIPSFTVSVVSKLLREAASVTLSAGERHVSTRIPHAEGNGETLVVSKVTEGNYPNTSRIIPKSCNGTIKVNREQLAGLVSRVSIACTELAKAIKLDVSAKEMTLSAASSENGEANEAMPIEYDGAAMSLALSNTMFSDALANISGEHISVELIDRVSPVTFRNDDPGYIHIAMPWKTT